MSKRVGGETLQFQICPLDVTNITMTMQVAVQEEEKETHRGWIGRNAHTADILAHKQK